MTNLSFKNALLTLLLIVSTTNIFAQSNTSTDERLKIRLGFTSVINSHRQLLVTEDANATSGIDFGYDGELYENFQNDMFWTIDNRQFVSQGIDIINADTVLTLGLRTGTDGVNTILIDELANVPADLEIVIYDNETETYHNIKGNSGFSINLVAGTYLNRFELRFTNRSADSNDDNNTDDSSNDDDTDNSTTLDTNEPIKDITPPVRVNTIAVSYINSTKRIAIKNDGLHIIKSVEVYNFIGQLVAQYKNITVEEETAIQTNDLKAGNYIIIANSDLGRITKKVNIN